jgi:peptidylprolyl isomerase
MTKVGGRLRDMRAPRFVSWSLFVTLGLAPIGFAGCGRTGAVPPKPEPSSVPAPQLPDASVMAPSIWGAPPPVDVSGPPPDAEREPSGVARKIITRGTGTVRPTRQSYVDMHYAGWERNGRQFEGTSSTGPTGRFDMTDLPEGLTNELLQMVEGDRRRIWVPAALAYANRPNFANAPRGDMTFEVELVRVIPMPQVPADVKGPPADAKSTKSGLTYAVLKKGTGKKHPADDSHLTVIYAGWRPDGRMFQCSLAASDTVRVLVSMLPPGWREAMKLMVEGDKWRLWLPGKLAFGDLPPGQEELPFGQPPGPIVIDVELVKIIDGESAKGAKK